MWSVLLTHLFNELSIPVHVTSMSRRGINYIIAVFVFLDGARKGNYSRSPAPRATLPRRLPPAAHVRAARVSGYVH